MHGLHALAWRGLRVRPLRSSLSAVGVALGVAVLFAGLVTSTGIDASIDRTVTSLMGRADLRVAAFGETGLSAETVAAIAGTPGVEVAAPALERSTYLGPALVAPGAALPAPVLVLGVAPDLEGHVRDLADAGGSPPVTLGDADAVVSATLARQDDLDIGSTFVVQGAGEPVTFRVVSILADDGPAAGGSGRAVIVPLGSAQAAFADDAVTRVDIALADGADAAAVTTALEARLLREPYVVSAPRDLAAAMRVSTTEFAATTALIGAVSLFCGAFLIFNTLSMSVVERVRELGLLRAAGATRGQLTGFILVQASVIGVAGGVLGVAFGAVLAAATAWWVGSVGTVALAAPAVTIGHAAVALGVGLVVTLAAALEPARRAGSIPPVEALRARLDLPTARRARLRWLIAVFIAIGAIGLLLWPTGGDASLPRSMAVYGVLLVAAMAVPLVLPVLARLAGIPFSWVDRLEERIARASVLRDRSRAALTVGALTVGIAMIVALGGVAQYARVAASAWIADVVPGDLVVTSIRPIGPDEGIREILIDQPGVATVSPIGTFDLAIDGVKVDGAAMVGADLAADGRLRFEAGDRAAALAAIDAGGAAIVPAGMAARDGLRVGDVLQATTDDGDAMPLEVVGVTQRTMPGASGETILVGWSDADRLGVAGADAFAVRYTPGATPAQHDALAAEARAFALEPVPLHQIHGAIGEALDRVFQLFDLLAMAAVVVASLGIVNTLTMNVLERVRELGVLRATGMTRRQVWRSVVVEAGITGLIGAACGIVAGLVVGAMMIVLAGGRIDGLDGVPWPAVAAAFVLGVALAMLAAAYPARLASGVSIVRAVGYE